MNDFIKLLYTLGLTLIIEYPIIQVLWIAIKKDEESKLAFWNNRIIIVPAIIVNVLTNPAINVFASYLWRETTILDNDIWTILTIIEIAIWLLEGVLYKYMLNTKLWKGLALAVSANFISYMFSFIVF